MVYTLVIDVKIFLVVTFVLMSTNALMATQNVLMGLLVSTLKVALTVLILTNVNSSHISAKKGFNLDG